MGENEQNETQLIHNDRFRQQCFLRNVTFTMSHSTTCLTFPVTFEKFIYFRLRSEVRYMHRNSLIFGHFLENGRLFSQRCSRWKTIVITFNTNGYQPLRRMSFKLLTFFVYIFLFFMILLYFFRRFNFDLSTVRDYCLSQYFSWRSIFKRPASHNGFDQVNPCHRETTHGKLTYNGRTNRKTISMTSGIRLCMRKHIIRPVNLSAWRTDWLIDRYCGFKAMRKISGFCLNPVQIWKHSRAIK